MTAEAEHTTDDQAAALREKARAGVAAAVARQLARGTAALTPPALLATLSAGALLPVATAAPAEAALAGIGVVSGVGANILSDVIFKAVEALRGRLGTAAPTSEQVESELTDRLERMLGEDGAQARLLRTELAAVLREIDAVGVSLRVALDSKDRAVQARLARLAEAFGTLGVRYDEFGFLLTTLDQAVEDIQLILRRQDAERRQDRERMRRQSVELMLIREELVALRRSRSSGRDDDRGAPRWHGTPYRGLQAFETDHGAVFHGREQATAALVGKLAERLITPSIVLVTGASGVGKSSLLRAGLLPALARGLLPSPGSQRWPYLLLTPTRTPLDELAVRLADVGKSDAPTLREALMRDPGQAHLVTRQAVLAATNADDARVVIVVDQFEEVFTLAEESGQGAAFITALAAAASTASGPAGAPPALVVIGVRGDFLDRCAEYPALAEAMTGGQYVLEPMTEAELRRAITGPAAAAGLELEPGLADVVLRDLRAGDGYGAGALPLLSQAMLATWENRDGDRLTIAGYGRGGGVQHAVQTSADAVFDALDADGQALARTLFQRMTAVSPDGRVVRRRVPRGELHGLTGRPGDVDAILEAFAAKRLLVLGEASVEIAHDCLLDAWPRLRGWLDDDRSGLLLESRLLDAAEEWERHGEDRAYLFRGPQLATARQRFADRDRYAALGPRGQRFLAASVRARRMRLWTAAGTAIVMMVALTIAGFGLRQRGVAIERGQLIASRQIAQLADNVRNRDPAAALQLSLAAYRIAPTAEARSSLFASYARPYPVTLGNIGPVRHVAFSHNGELLASAGADKTLRLWDVRDPFRPASRAVLRVDGPATVAFSPDDRLLAAQSARTLQLWDVTDPGRPVLKASRPSPSNEWTGVAFSPAAPVVATVGEAGRARLWNIADAANPVIETTMALGPPEVYAVAFSPDGKILATGSGARGNELGTARVRLWTITDPRRPTLRATMKADSVMSIAISPGGDLLVAGGVNGSLKGWNVSDPGSPAQLPILNLVSRGVVNAVAFSPMENAFVAADGTGGVPVWRFTERFDFFKHDGDRYPTSGSVFSAAVSPDGRVVACAGEEGVLLWRQLMSPVPGSIGGIEILDGAFSPDGRLMAVRAEPDSAQEHPEIWDLTDPHHPVRAAVIPGDWRRSGFLRHGRTLVTQSRDYSSLALWDVADPRHPVRLSVFPAEGRSLHVTPDDRALVVADGSHATIWDIADPRHPVVAATIPRTGAVPAFLDDATLMLNHGGLLLWDVRDRRRPVRAGSVELTEVASGFAFDSDTRLLAVWSRSVGLDLWDLSDIRRPRRYPLSLFARVTTAPFIDSDTLAVVTDNDKSVVLLDVRDPARPQRIGAFSGEGGVKKVEADPEGRLIAIVTQTAPLAPEQGQLWDVADPTAPAYFGELPGNVTTTTFRPDGNVIAIEQQDITLGGGAAVMLMDVRPDEVHRYLCSLPLRPLTSQQWDSLVGTIHPYEKACP